jgi:metallophosphoesterase superfamily enzyme
MQADSHLDENTEPAIYARAVENMLADGVDFVVDLGDTFMNDKYSSDYKESEKQYLAQRYYFGLVGHSAAWLLALGNHDGEQGRYLNGTVDDMTDLVESNAEITLSEPGTRWLLHRKLDPGSACWSDRELLCLAVG